MSADSSHLSPSVLTAFSAGRAPPAAIDSIARHLAECAKCRAAAESLPPGRLETLAGASRVTARPHAPDAELPSIPDYEMLRVAGSGGMGVVYQARHTIMNRLVAIKMMREEDMHNHDLRERFLRADISLLARLDHPNIVRVESAGEVGDRPFVVMKWIEGRSLAQAVQDDGPLAVETACEVISQVSAALQYLHESGHVFRDVKPQNIMLTDAGKAVLLDFGLARETDRPVPDSDLTRRGAILGTPQYMAPEQAKNAHEATIRADIYSLGMVFYFLLTGEVPFPGRDVYGLLAAHQQDEPVPVSKLRAGVPSRLIAVLQKMTMKKPGDRFQTPNEVIKALAAARRPYRDVWVKRAAAAAVVLVPLVAPLVGHLRSPHSNAPISSGVATTPEAEQPAPEPAATPTPAPTPAPAATPEPKNVRLTRVAWAAYEKAEELRAADKYSEARQQFARAMNLADECVVEFLGRAQDAQATLAASNLPPPKEGKLDDPAERKLVLDRGPLNDVCTCLWIQGRCLARLGKKEEARKVYETAARLSYAVCWNQKEDSFWHPAQKAQDDLNFIDKLPLPPE